MITQAEVSGAFGGLDTIAHPSDQVAPASDRPFGGLAQHRLERGEGPLDPIELGTVGREKPDAGA